MTDRAERQGATAQVAGGIVAVPACWTDDCQGKKDYDGVLVSLSTRYWPRGGGYTVIYRVESEARPEIKPSAHATIYLGSTENTYYETAVKLVEQEFEGDTQEEVQRAVEGWAQEQYARIQRVLVREFSTVPREPARTIDPD